MLIYDVLKMRSSNVIVVSERCVLLIPLLFIRAAVDCSSVPVHSYVRSWNNKKELDSKQFWILSQSCLKFSSFRGRWFGTLLLGLCRVASQQHPDFDARSTLIALRYRSKNPDFCATHLYRRLGYGPFVGFIFKNFTFKLFKCVPFRTVFRYFRGDSTKKS